ncbi:MAG: tRNA 2-selenouridine(34) synthase MnmH [Deltaproteobacteria bacterium RIFCSPHIGHO2_02_FULL_40_11]|nr:MAG: tRNA 2-selenouridine(34) synthase MnmH [Deltaproteobacteria bacterium RIFCSPHIGHO2_02_FULL_40_11]
MLQKISIQKALSLQNSKFIDVRTPLEFEEGTIPGAINIPLLSNEERIEIGTLYKQKGPLQARARGLELVSPKFHKILNDVKASVIPVNAGIQKPVFFCWRGGLRSQTVATVLDLAGLDVWVVEGGYKAYRKEVLDVLSRPLPFQFITLYGFTGSGKTELLQNLKKQGAPTIDLEALACHRGSAFGHVGIVKPQTQKQFEALLYREVMGYQNEKYVLIEGESRRIGPVLLPEAFLNQMLRGKRILIQGSLPFRTQRILEEYFKTPQNIEQIKTATLAIQKRLGGVLFKNLMSFLETKDYQAFTSSILENYYDKNYKYSSDQSLSFEDNLPIHSQNDLDQAVPYFLRMV